MSIETDWLDMKPGKAVVPKRQRPSRSRRPKALIMAERSLTLEKRYFVRMMAESTTSAEAGRRMVAAGFPKRCRETYWRWQMNPQVAEALSLTEEWQFKCFGVTKASLMNDAEKIKQHALENRPILYKGEATGYKDADGVFHEYEERELGLALRAVEFQGKGLGITDPDQRGVKVNIDIDFSGRAMGVTIEGDSETMAVE